MFIVGMFRWWYSDGWLQCVRSVQGTLLGVYDYFSIDLLLRTLFSPFRQISAGKVNGPVGVQLRAWFDQLISRTIGAFVRSVVIIIGSAALFLSVVWGLIRLIAWPLVPLLPVIGVLLAMSGWIPWKI